MRVIFFLLSFVFAGQALAQDKPNMLIIWGDDIGFGISLPTTWG